MALSFWHGSHNWDGPPEIRPARAKHAEHGPGIYLTTKYETAAKYARGGGRVMKVTVDEPLAMLSDARASLSDMEGFLRQTARVKNRPAIISGLRAYAARTKSETSMPIAALVNLMVNHDAAVGAPGVSLAHFLVSMGVDADIVTWGDEDWLVVFNVGKIASVSPANPTGASDYNLPLVRGRLLRV